MQLFKTQQATLETACRVLPGRIVTVAWQNAKVQSNLTRQVIVSKKAITTLVVAIIASVAVLAIGGYQLGWWIKADSTERQVQIDNSNTGTQTAWHDQAVQGIRDYELVDPSNTAARGALRDQTCGLIARLADPYRDDIVVAFYEEECK